MAFGGLLPLLLLHCLCARRLFLMQCPPPKDLGIMWSTLAVSLVDFLPHFFMPSPQSQQLPSCTNHRMSRCGFIAHFLHDPINRNPVGTIRAASAPPVFKVFREIHVFLIRSPDKIFRPIISAIFIQMHTDIFPGWSRAVESLADQTRHYLLGGVPAI